MNIEKVYSPACAGYIILGLSQSPFALGTTTTFVDSKRLPCPFYWSQRKNALVEGREHIEDPIGDFKFEGVGRKHEEDLVGDFIFEAIVGKGADPAVDFKFEATVEEPRVGIVGREDGIKEICPIAYGHLLERRKHPCS